MKVQSAGRMLLAVAAMMVATAARGQEPWPIGAPGSPHRPPIERSFGGPGGGPGGRWWNNPKVIEKLKLTDEQRKGFDQTLLAHREKLIDLRANLEKAEIPMQTLIDADQPDEAKILAQIDKTVQARAELEKANARFLLALRSKLSVEQWKQLKELHESRPPWRDGAAPEHRRPGQGAGKDGGNLPLPPPPGPIGQVDDGNGPDGGADRAPEPGPGR